MSVERMDPATAGVRLAGPQDAAAIADLVRSAYRGEESRAGWTTEADLLDDERIDAGQVLEKLQAQTGEILLHELAGDLVGCCEVASRGDGLAYFGMFAVRPALQAAGLGRSILAAAEVFARDQWGAEVMEMTVIEQRTELIAWYQRRGYELTGETRPFPFGELINGTALRTDLRFQVLAKRLAGPGAQHGAILDIAYRTIDSPVGLLLLAATDAGLVRVAYAAEGHEAVLQSLLDRVSPRIVDAPARLDGVAAELDEYFTGRRQTFGLRLDWRLSAGFRRTVLQHLAQIGYGHTASYSTLAALAGNPSAVRAAATACATNPLPVVVPCHRVIRADGSIGEYLGGTGAKRLLLTLEAEGT